MRITFLLASAVLSASLLACKPPPRDQAVRVFQKEIHLHFQNLNNEANQRKEDLRKGLALAAANPAMAAPTGTILNTFSFDENAFVVLNYKCKTCEARLILPVPSAEYLCKSCGHCPYIQHPAGFNKTQSPCAACLGPEGKPKAPSDVLVSRDFFQKEEGCVVKNMFELPADASPEKPMRATVRYVRQQWSYDARGTVASTQKITEKAAIDPEFLPVGAEYDAANPKSRFQRAGFHRLDAVYVGELQFEYRGGDVRPVTKAREEAVRPWKDLGRNN